MAGFPFFRLPFQLARSALNMMDLVEITHLFLCSQKTRNFIEATEKPLSFDLLSIEQKESLDNLTLIEFCRLKDVQDKPFVNGKLKVAETIEIQLIWNDYRSQLSSIFSIHVACTNQQNKYEGTKGNLKINGITVPMIMTNKETMYTFWNCQYEGLSILSDYIQKIFDSRFEDYIIYGSKEPSPSLKAAVKWMGQQKRLDNCYVKNAELISHIDYKYILDNVNPKWRFCHSGKQSDEFQHDTKFKSRILSLKPANWFTIDNLLNTDSKLIYLYKSKLTNDDLKEYLKQWVAGKFSKLEFLVVEMEGQIDLEHIISGLPGYKPGKPLGREYYKLDRIGGGEICITQKNKSIATIKKYANGIFEMSVRLK